MKRQLIDKLFFSLIDKKTTEIEKIDRFHYFIFKIQKQILDIAIKCKTSQ